MAKTIQFEPVEPGRQAECEACEAMLTDAVDQVLSSAEQAWFDAHIAGCEHCSALLADAQRGVAWLEMLKSPRPEPSSHLLEKIFAQTSGQVGDQTGGQVLPERPVITDNLPATAPLETPQIPLRAPLLPFRPRIAPVPRWVPTFANPSFNPRLAMTAAMAFFSIALTLNLTGVRLDELHTADLNPSTLKRSFYEAKGDAARRYDSLRVVHVLESRVEDLKAAGVGIELTGTGDSGRRRVSPAEPGTPDQPERTPQRSQPSAPRTAHPGVSHWAAPGLHPVYVPATDKVRPTSARQEKWGRV